MFIIGVAIEQDYFKSEIRRLAEEIEKQRGRNKGLVGRIAIMEANAARLGFDPEEMHKPVLKPVRTMSRAGTAAAGPRRPRLRSTLFDLRVPQGSVVLHWKNQFRTCSKISFHPSRLGWSAKPNP